MKFVPVASYPYFRARCLACGVVMESNRQTVYADLDGPAFAAYYCEAHARRATGAEVAAVNA